MLKVWKICLMATLKIGWSKYGPFSNRCVNILTIFKQTLKKKTCPGRSSALGAPPEAAPGVFFQNMFENGPYFQTSVWKWTIFGSSYFQSGHQAFFSNFHHLVGDASYHPGPIPHNSPSWQCGSSPPSSGQAHHDAVKLAQGMFFWPLSLCISNLRPLLNAESLKNLPDGHFENRMIQIWSIFKQMCKHIDNF